MAEQPTPARDARTFGGMLSIALAASCWGTWSLFFRPAEASGRVTPALEAFVVFAVILLVAAPLALRDRLRVRRPVGAWLALGAAGFCDAANALLFFWAMQRTHLAIAVLTHYLAPVLVAVGAPLALGERVRGATLGALGLSLAGLTVLLEPWHAVGAGVWVGAALGAGSAVFFSASLLLAKRLGRHFAPTEILAWHMPTALLVLAPFLSADALAVPPAALGLLVAGGLGPGALAGVVFLRALAHVEASRASVLMLLEPVVAVLLGILVWHEPLRPLAAIGAALVLGAAWWVLSATRTG